MSGLEMENEVKQKKQSKVMQKRKKKEIMFGTRKIECKIEDYNYFKLQREVEVNIGRCRTISVLCHCLKIGCLILFARLNRNLGQKALVLVNELLRNIKNCFL